MKCYIKSANGYELQFASNHLGQFLPTNSLAEKLFATAEGARIVNVTIDRYGLGSMRFGDCNFSVIHYATLINMIVALTSNNIS